MFLEVKNLKKYYGDGDYKRCILKGLNFSVKQGSIVVILGPSGSGKSTALNLIGGLEQLDEGDIVVDGRSLANCKKDDIAAYRRDLLGFVFQSYNLIPNLTVKENIEVCQKLGDGSVNLDEILNLLGLTEHKNKFPRHLSGGQQQRVAIARALIKNPKLLLCDEPTGALDYETSKETLKVLEMVNQRFGTTMLIVTHNEAISGMAHQVLKIREGVIATESFCEKPISADEIEW